MKEDTMENSIIENKIKLVINKYRPFLQNDGGDVEYVEYKDGIVYLRMLGACIGCSQLDYTIGNGIEAALIEEVPEVIGVQLV